jgi:membrane-associated phospholipid phosphatase
VNLGRAIGRMAASVTLACRAISARPPRALSPGQLLLRLAADQKKIWTFPLTLERGNGLMPALGVIGATAALIALDPVYTPCLQQPEFQELPAVRALNHILSGGNMARLINAVPLGVFVGGLVCRNSRAWQTALLAGEAAANAEIIAIAMKHADRRMRPIEVGPNGDFSHTWFRTKNRDIDGMGCFPSGHTAASFAIATVFAERYPRSRWAAWLAYGLAGTIGVSRVNARAHFPSDVFFGAVVGYSISHFVVMQREMTAGRHLTAGS